PRRPPRPRSASSGSPSNRDGPAPCSCVGPTPSSATRRTLCTSTARPPARSTAPGSRTSELLAEPRQRVRPADAPPEQVAAVDEPDVAAADDRLHLADVAGPERGRLTRAQPA